MEADQDVFVGGFGQIVIGNVLTGLFGQLCRQIGQGEGRAAQFVDLTFVPLTCGYGSQCFGVILTGGWRDFCVTGRADQRACLDGGGQ